MYKRQDSLFGLVGVLFKKCGLFLNTPRISKYRIKMRKILDRSVKSLLRLINSLHSELEGKTLFKEIQLSE